MSDDQLYYGEVFGELAFAREARLRELAAMWSTLESAATWGALKSMSRELYDHCVAHRADGPEEAPSDEAPFDAQQVATVADGDFPPSLHEEHTDWMPPEVLVLGRREAGALGGDWVAFAPEDEDAVVAALRAGGFDVRRDDALIAAASGS